MPTCRLPHVFVPFRFHWTIWLALGLTLLCIPIIIWLVENLVLVRIQLFHSSIHPPILTFLPSLSFCLQTGSVPLSASSVHDWRHAIYTTLLQVGPQAWVLDLNMDLNTVWI